MKKYLWGLFLLLFCGSCYAAGTPTTNYRYTTGEFLSVTTFNARYDNRKTSLTTTKDFNIYSIKPVHMYRSSTETFPLCFATSWPSYNILAVPLGYNTLVSVSLNNIAGVETRNILYRPITSTAAATLLSQNVSNVGKVQFNIPLIATNRYYIEVSNSSNVNSIQVALARNAIVQGTNLKLSPYTAVGASSAFGASTISNLFAWYKADTGITTVGSNVSNWADQSGNGYDISQATAGERPYYQSNLINGYGGVTKSYTSGLRRLVNSSLPATNQPLTFFIVCSHGLESTQRIYMYSGGGLQFQTDHPQIGKLGLYAGIFQSGSTITTDTWYVETYVISSNASYIQINQETPVIINPGTQGMGTQLIVGDHITSGYSPNFKVVEILIYSRRLADAEVLVVQTYLKNKFAL